MVNHASMRRVKVHRSYTVQELARTIGGHENTVRRWITKEGLPTIDDSRPTLVSGAEVKAFLEARHRSRKRPCAPEQMYCFRCREARTPALSMADCIPIDDATGNLTGLCPACGTLMNKRVALARLGVIAAQLDIRFPKGR